MLPTHARTRALLVLLTTAVVGAAAVAALPASAGEFATNGAHGHGKVIFPDKQHGAHAAGGASGSGNLHYGGAVDGVGVTTGPPKVYLVFWGTQWGTETTTQSGIWTFANDPAGIASRLQQMYQGFGTNGELWSGVMTQYCEGVAAGTKTCPSTASHVAYPGAGVLAGVIYDTSSAAPAQATEHQLAVEAVNMATTNGNSRDTQYVIVSPTGTHPDGFNTSQGNFCAWHDYNGDTTLTGGAAASTVGDVAFTNLPYIPDMGASCGAGYVNGASGALDGVTIVAGHEYAETLTDEYPAGGWTDNIGYENADKCAWNGVGGLGGAQNVAFGTGTFPMQATYSNDVSACRISHAVVGGGTTGNTVAVTSPGNQTSTVATSVSLQMSGSDSGGGDLSLTYSATGLPAGLSISSNGLISGSPTTAAISSVTVTAKDSTGASGSTAFTWTVNPSSSGGCTAAQLIGNPGFENGTAAAPWSATASVIDNSTAEPAHSGSWKAWLDGYGTTHTDTLSQSVSIPSGCTTATFSFWLHIDTRETTTRTAYDKLSVVVGSTTVATYSNLNRNSGYAQHSFNVAGFGGRTVTITFTGTENSSRQTSFVVDDTALNVS